MKTKFSNLFKFMFVFIMAVVFSGTYGCMKPYDTPEYKEISNSETVYVIPLEQAVDSQVKFDSVQYLEKRKVSGKRIQIPHRWNQTGRYHHNGEWIPTVKVITVDRQPITREWKESGDGKGGKADNAIWVESADSLGFSMGWTCTAYIKEEDTSQFLYMYSSGSLAGVIDSEIRARVQQKTAEVAAMYTLDKLRDKKNEIATAVKNDVNDFFSKRGITITTIGMFGGMQYDNKKIQESIDQTFVSQQEKVTSAAMLAAQADKNTRINSEAVALAEAARTKAKGEADGQLAIAEAVAKGNLAKAQAEAKGIEAVNDAIAKANNNPILIQLKQIEVDKIRATTWKGDVPQTVVGGDTKPFIMVGGTPVAAASVSMPL